MSAMESEPPREFVFRAGKRYKENEIAKSAIEMLTRAGCVVDVQLRNGNAQPELREKGGPILYAEGGENIEQYINTHIGRIRASMAGAGAR